MLKRVKIDGVKSKKMDIELTGRDIFDWPNGSGKSTIKESIHFGVNGKMANGDSYESFKQIINPRTSIELIYAKDDNNTVIKRNIVNGKQVIYINGKESIQRNANIEIDNNVGISSKRFNIMELLQSSTMKDRMRMFFDTFGELIYLPVDEFIEKAKWELIKISKSYKTLAYSLEGIKDVDAFADEFVKRIPSGEREAYQKLLATLNNYKGGSDLNKAGNAIMETLRTAKNEAQSIGSVKEKAILEIGGEAILLEGHDEKIKELEDNIAKIDADISILNKNINARKAYDALKSKIDNVEYPRKVDVSEIASIKNQIKKKEAEQKAISEGNEKKHALSSKYYLEIEAIKNELKELKTVKENIEKIDTNKETIKHHKENIAKKEKKISALKVKEKELSEKMRTDYDKHIHNIEKDIKRSELSSSLGSELNDGDICPVCGSIIKDTKESFRKKITTDENNISEMKKKLKKLNTDRNKITRELDQNTEDIKALASAITSNELKIKKLEGGNKSYKETTKGFKKASIDKDIETLEGKISGIQANMDEIHLTNIEKGQKELKGLNANLSSLEREVVTFNEISKKVSEYKEDLDKMIVTETSIENMTKEIEQLNSQKEALQLRIKEISEDKGVFDKKEKLSIESTKYKLIASNLRSLGKEFKRFLNAETTKLYGPIFDDINKFNVLDDEIVISKGSVDYDWGIDRGGAFVPFIAMSEGEQILLLIAMIISFYSHSNKREKLLIIEGAPLDVGNTAKVLGVLLDAPIDNILFLTNHHVDEIEGWKRHKK